MNELLWVEELAGEVNGTVTLVCLLISARPCPGPCLVQTPMCNVAPAQNETREVEHLGYKGIDMSSL